MSKCVSGSKNSMYKTALGVTCVENASALLFSSDDKPLSSHKKGTATDLPIKKETSYKHTQL